MASPKSQAPEANRKLRLTDRACCRLLLWYARFKGYRFGIANSDQQEKSACLFARNIFEESGFYESEDQPEPPEETGTRSTFFLAWHKSELVGTLELVQTECELPVELFFNFKFPNSVARDNVAELTRFTIAQEHRGRNPVVAMGLLCAALRFSVENQIRWWIGCTQSLLLAGFGKLFRDWKVLPELPPGPRQQRFRKGRDGFFHPSRGLRVFLVDSWSISFSTAAKKLIARRLKARKRRSKSR